MMSSPPSLPEDPFLAEVARTTQRAPWSWLIADDQLRIVYVSPEMRVFVGEHDEDRLGYGKHIAQAWLTETWLKIVSPEAAVNLFNELVPSILALTPGGKAALRPVLPEPFAQMLEPFEAVPLPPVLLAEADYVQDELSPLPAFVYAVRLFSEDQRFRGILVLVGPGIPSWTLVQLGRGDQGMFERMGRLIEPGQRSAAVLFADLQNSGALSKKMSSAAYFRLVREITTAVDGVVVAHSGIVGRHAGDGMTAFFVADDFRSASSTARAAVDCARDVRIAAHDATKSVAEEAGTIMADECAINIGVHWGARLYMGQISTGGRLEVSALGDEVNECARLQESARDGQILASKSLLELLTAEDANALGLDPFRIVYFQLGELAGASEKAARDAGGLAVAIL